MDGGMALLLYYAILLKRNPRTFWRGMLLVACIHRYNDYPFK